MIYVDDMYLSEMGRFRRMKMSHLIADTEAELLAMVDKIGVARRWRQGTPDRDDHFDIALSKRALAVRFGAIEIPWRTLGLMVAVRKRTGTLPKPEEAERRFRALWANNEQIKLLQGAIDAQANA